MIEINYSVMKKIVLVILISLIVGFTAFTDTVDKIKEKQWGWAILAIVVCGIVIPIFAVYLRKLKNFEEKGDQKKKDP